MYKKQTAHHVLALKVLLHLSQADNCSGWLQCAELSQEKVDAVRSSAMELGVIAKIHIARC
jgi:hypothetical protein